MQKFCRNTRKFKGFLTTANKIINRAPGRPLISVVQLVEVPWFVTQRILEQTEEKRSMYSITYSIRGSGVPCIFVRGGRLPFGEAVPINRFAAPAKYVIRRIFRRREPWASRRVFKAAISVRKESGQKRAAEEREERNRRHAMTRLRIFKLAPKASLSKL